MDEHFLKTSDAAIQDAMKGLRKTENQVAFGRAVDRMYGQYGKFSPGMRKAIAYYTPFIAWSLNAVRFMADVLPNDHPALTAALTANVALQEEWLADEGLREWAEGALPGFLQGSYPGPNGEHWRVARYTPFGFFSDPFGSASGLFVPQIKGVVQNMAGEDWKGDDLEPITSESGRADTKDKALYVGWTLLNSMIPAVAVPARAVKMGGTIAGEGSATDKAAKILGMKVNPPKSAGRPKKGNPRGGSTRGSSSRGSSSRGSSSRGGAG
jgi:hypothetical protein